MGNKLALALECFAQIIHWKIGNANQRNYPNSASKMLLQQ
jgi:hypothetical protein